MSRKSIRALNSIMVSWVGSSVLLSVAVALPAGLRTSEWGGNGGRLQTAGGSARLASPANTLVTFTNPANIMIPDSGSAGLYPSDIAVAGLTGTLTSVKVTLNNLSHTFPDDIDILLVGPTGANLIIMSDVGGVGPGVMNVTVTLDDNAMSSLNTDDAVVTGSFKPSDAFTTGDFFDPPAPGGPYNHSAPQGTSTFASVFNGTNPNGTWSLYVVDDGAPDSGNIAGGWTLNLQTTTSARMSAAEAIRRNDGTVQLDWQTGYEIDNLGFNIYREENGERALVNPQLIAGSALLAGPGGVLTAGQSYRWEDLLPTGKLGVRYWIEDVDLNGTSTWHGPIAVQAPGYRLQASKFEHNRSVLLSRLGRDDPGNQATGYRLQATAFGHDRSVLTVGVEPRPTFLEPTVEQTETQLRLVAQPAVKLSVRQEGWYRLTQPELLAGGLSAGVDPRLLQVFADGQEVPILVEGERDGRFDPKDTIEFYGIGLDTPYTDAHAYWLVAGQQAGKRVNLVQSQGGTLTLGSFPYIVERKDRSIYFSSLRNGDADNFFGAVIAKDPVDQALTLRHVDQTAGTEALLEVALQGVSKLPHQVSVQFNGVDAGMVAFEGQAQGRGNLKISHAALREGTNQVRLMAQGGPSDVSLVDFVRVTYWHTYTADDDALRFTASGHQAVTLAGFTSGRIRVIDITNPDTVQEVVGSVLVLGGGYAVTFTVPAAEQRTFLAFTDGKTRKPASIRPHRPSNLRESARGSDFIIIARREFFDSLGPLKAWRESQGLSVVMVDVGDAYDEFAFGNKSPQAIKDFLAFARTNWKRAPRFLLLAADASVDPRNYLGGGDSDLVPTKIIDTQIMETASDDWFADWDGDGVPEMAVGRIPARTAPDLAAMVDKIIRYEQSPKPDGVLLVADRNEDFDFEGTSQQLRALIPDIVGVTEIRRGQMNDATAREALLSCINRGPRIVNYTGHGSIDYWRGNLLTSQDAAGLTNRARLPLFVMMTCLNGYFVSVAQDSLAESLMKASEGGAIAVWASSGFTAPAQQVVMNQAMFRAIFAGKGSNGGSQTLGEITSRAKATITDRDVRRTWILFGDPATRLK